MEDKNFVINTSLRLTEKRNDYIRKKASEIGISQNAFINILIDLGIRLYELNLEDVLSRNGRCRTE